MMFPLFAALPITLMYFGCWKRKPKPLPNEPDDIVYCCGKKSDNREAILDVITRPYRDDILGGISWDGIINLRRMIMVVCFSFINDRLLKQMSLAFCCFGILLIHIKSDPFKQRLSNHAESISLSLLVVISGTNLVKAAFFHSQTISQGANYLIIVMYEWVEVAAPGFLPLAILVIIIIAMVAKTGTLFFGPNAKEEPTSNGRKDDDTYRRNHNGHYVSQVRNKNNKGSRERPRRLAPEGSSKAPRSLLRSPAKQV
jgi:hypothetical protein